MKLSPTESVGSSTAKPPAWATPRFTSAARSRSTGRLARLEQRLQTDGCP